VQLEIADELGNTWRLEGPYKEVCDEDRTFNMLKERLTNKEFFCNKDPIKKKYALLKECTVPVYSPKICCIKDKTMRRSYECPTTEV
jgi:hypothetical protein